MSKKRIIIMAAAGLISFAGAFVFAWFSRSAAQERAAESEGTAVSVQETVGELPKAEMPVGVDVVGSGAGKAAKEKRFDELVYDVRVKIQEYNNKLQNLEVTEQRLQIAQEALKADIDKLNKLRVELAGIVASLKDEQNKLLESRVKIAGAEKENLIKIAATYDKMDSASASKILTNMSQMQGSGGGESSFDDAVKILHYMTERTKAKLLAELVTSEPKLAAVLCRRLKEIVEKE